MKWNFLVVDDDEAMAQQTAEILQSARTLDGAEITCEVCTSFELAKEKVLVSRYDLVVLDLRDDAGKIDLKGQEVLDLLREAHFVPVVFYTGHSHKVESLKTPFVQVVAKGDEDADRLRQAVRDVFSTRLPELIRYIQEQQRLYLWSHVDEFWKRDGAICDVRDLAYLLARRLGSALEGASIRKFLKEGDVQDVAHPAEVYIWPALGDSIQSGDILRVEGQIFLVLNPACDFVQGKVELLVAAECVPLAQCVEYSGVADAKRDGGQPNGNQIGALKNLIGDNRQKSQPERYKFLPKTVFLDNHVVDFQRVKTFPLADLGAARVERIATLDSPFAESVVSRFSRYYGRIGAPNLERERIADEIIAQI